MRSECTHFNEFPYVLKKECVKVFLQEDNVTESLIPGGRIFHYFNQSQNVGHHKLWNDFGIIDM